MLSKLKRLFSLHFYFDKLARNTYDTNASILLHRLFPKSTILPFTTFSLNPNTILHIINEIQINNRKSIIEFGAGVSTIITAKFIAENNINATIVSVEDNLSWLNFISSQLEKYNCQHAVQLLHVPLKNSDSGVKWYDQEQLKSNITNKKFDLILVDGPSGGLGKNARKPVLPLLLNYLNQSFIIFLDDVRRLDEQQILDEWTTLLRENNFDAKKNNTKSRIYGTISCGESFSSNPVNH
jgi:predicted O-methyltransferase YrrM